MERPFVDKQKTKYFSEIGLRSLAAMRLHMEQGLWERTGANERSWGNVSEHCLVEAARVEVFADLLGLPTDIKSDLSLAAASHDFYKKHEVAKLRANDTSWDAYAEAQVEAKQVLDASPLSSRVIHLATSVGHETLDDATTILSKEQLEPIDIAWLIMHYVDDYTIDASWAEPASDKDGTLGNDFTRRMDRNREQAQEGGRYYGINQAGHQHFGRATYDAQELVGNQVQSKLAELLTSKTGNYVDPLRLPELIDQEIESRIINS